MSIAEENTTEQTTVKTEAVKKINVMALLAKLNAVRIQEGKPALASWDKSNAKLEKEVNNLPSNIERTRGAISYAIRDLDKRGIKRGVIAKLLGISYNHVYNVLHMILKSKPAIEEPVAAAAEESIAPASPEEVTSPVLEQELIAA